MASQQSKKQLINTLRPVSQEVLIIQSCLFKRSFDQYKKGHTTYNFEDNQRDPEINSQNMKIEQQLNQNQKQNQPQSQQNNSNQPNELKLSHKSILLQIISKHRKPNQELQVYRQAQFNNDRHVMQNKYKHSINQFKDLQDSEDVKQQQFILQQTQEQQYGQSSCENYCSHQQDYESDCLSLSEREQQQYLHQKKQKSYRQQQNKSLQQKKSKQSKQSKQFKQFKQPKYSNQNNQNQNQREGQREGSIDNQKQQSQLNSSKWFIPWIKTQNDIRKQQWKLQQLIKLNTPLMQQQILPWFTPQIKQINDPVIRLHQQIISFYQYIKPTNKQHETKLLIFEDLKKIIQRIYPEADVQHFGSFATRLYLPQGDIDIVVLLKNKQKLDKEKRNETLNYMENIYNQLRRNHKDSYKYLQLVKRAKIPLIKCYHKQTGTSIDVSFNNDVGIKQIEQTRKINQIYPEFKFLIFVLKCMLKSRRLSDTYTGGIGSFLLVCMLFHYLRTTHSCSFTAGYSLGQYLLQFFSFYFMDPEWSCKSINVKDGSLTKRSKNKKYSISMICPFDGQTDIGIKAFRMRDVLLMFKNRHKQIKQKHFYEGESILKEIINPNMQEFMFYQAKLKYMENGSEIETYLNKIEDKQQASSQKLQQKQKDYEQLYIDSIPKQTQKSKVKDKMSRSSSMEDNRRQSLSKSWDQGHQFYSQNDKSASPYCQKDQLYANEQMRSYENCYQNDSVSY